MTPVRHTKHWKTAVMSIKPKYAALIKSGAKRVEFRTTNIRHLKRLIFYETIPVQMCTCETRIVHIARDTSNKMWEMSRSQAGIDRTMFDSYTGGKSEVTALFFDDVLVYDKPKPLSAFGIRNQPLRAYVYLDGDQCHAV